MGLLQSFIFRSIMNRISSINQQINASPNNYTSKSIYLILAKRNNLIQALDPHLTYIIKNLIQKSYPFILPKVQDARKYMRSLSLNNQNKSSQARQREAFNNYRKYLQDKLYEVYPTIFNEIADHLSSKIQIKHDRNGIIRGLGLYSSIMGSYQLKLSMFDRLTPNLKTLSELQWQANHQPHQNDFARRIWMVVFIFFFAYVMIFKRYITTIQKNELIELIKVKFIDSLAEIVQNIYDCQGENQVEVGRKLDEWILEVHNSNKK